jgi:type I restriction enzyme S subunit
MSDSWLVYFLNHSDLSEYVSGLTVPKLNQGSLRQIRIPRPPLPEQERIVAILDEAFANIAIAKANTEKEVNGCLEIFDSQLELLIMDSDHGSRHLTLSEMSLDFGRGKSKHRPRNAPQLYGGPYPFIQTGDIRAADHYIHGFGQTYSEMGLAQSKLWPAGTVCITIAANIAETAILGFKACFPDSVIGLVPNPSLVMTDYVEYLLSAFKVKLQALGKGSAQANLNLATFESEMFPVPDLHRQAEICTNLNELSKSLELLRTKGFEKLAALEELKKALLHQAFSGQL